MELHITTSTMSQVTIIPSTLLPYIIELFLNQYPCAMPVPVTTELSLCRDSAKGSFAHRRHHRRRQMVIILLEVLLKPRSPYSFGGTPKARQPLLSCLSPPQRLQVELTLLSVTLSRAYKWN